MAVQLEYQHFGKTMGTQITRSSKPSPGVVPSKGGKVTPRAGQNRSSATNRGEFCKQLAEHEGDCEPEAIAATWNYIEVLVWREWDKPRETAETWEDIAQECFKVALKERKKGPVCLCRLAQYKWKHVMINRGKRQRVHERTEGGWAIETQGKTKLESLWGLEAGQPFPAQVVVVDPLTTEHLLLRVEAEKALEEEKAYQLALIQEVAERVRRMHTGAVINYLMYEDDAPKVDRRIVHKEIEALQRDVGLIGEEREIKGFILLVQALMTLDGNTLLVQKRLVKSLKEMRKRGDKIRGKLPIQVWGQVS